MQTDSSILGNPLLIRMLVKSFLTELFVGIGIASLHGVLSDSVARWHAGHMYKQP